MIKNKKSRMPSFQITVFDEMHSDLQNERWLLATQVHTPAASKAVRGRPGILAPLLGDFVLADVAVSSVECVVDGDLLAPPFSQCFLDVGEWVEPLFAAR